MNSGQWRWTITHRNGEIICAATEAYHNYKDCVTALTRMVQAILDNKVKVDVRPLYD